MDKTDKRTLYIDVLLLGAAAVIVAIGVVGVEALSPEKIANGLVDLFAG